MGKTENILLLGMVGLLIVGLVTVISSRDQPEEEGPSTPQTGTINPLVSGEKADMGTSMGFDAKTDEGRVTVKLTPIKFEDGKLYFEISLNTHSVELGQFNLTELTSLEFEGKEIKPISAPETGSHHSSGILVFNTGKELDRFTVKIRDLDSEERTFNWP